MVRFLRKQSPLRVQLFETVGGDKDKKWQIYGGPQARGRQKLKQGGNIKEDWIPHLFQLLLLKNCANCISFAQ